jgi:hypothetical protein
MEKLAIDFLLRSVGSRNRMATVKIIDSYRHCDTRTRVNKRSSAWRILLVVMAFLKINRVTKMKNKLRVSNPLEVTQITKIGKLATTRRDISAYMRGRSS